LDCIIQFWETNRLCPDACAVELLGKGEEAEAARFRPLDKSVTPDQRAFITEELKRARQQVEQALSLEEHSPRRLLCQDALDLWMDFFGPDASAAVGC
jgi:hypothetical protein